ncbi:hypothetical protein QBC36DRAFT_324093 [Triangularia setosa]|uniref:Uncharacterized protein n=1 Tax=Triangularia setosa TaxID=2587417 RepID=A0AAN7A823_9PEZI|nr:hypothetical protein QBC36DRAFT_324093 [Podospora setosa]
MHLGNAFPLAGALTLALAQDISEVETTTITHSSTSIAGPSSVAGSFTSTITTFLPSDFLDVTWGDACVDQAKSILNAQPTPPLGQPLRDYFESSFSVFVTANLATSSIALAHTPIKSEDIVTLCEQWQTTRWVGQTVPASVTAEHEAYKSAWSSWASAAESALESAVESCETRVSNVALGQAFLAVATNDIFCSEGFSLLHGLKTPAWDADVTSTTSTRTFSTAGAARETGYVAAALIAAAGVVAVI